MQLSLNPKKLNTKKITKTYLLPEDSFCYLSSLPVAKVCYPPKKLISSPVYSIYHLGILMESNLPHASGYLYSIEILAIFGVIWPYSFFIQISVKFMHTLCSKATFTYLHESQNHVIHISLQKTCDICIQMQ